MVGFSLESVVALLWIRWSASLGTGGRFPSEYACTFAGSSALRATAIACFKLSISNSLGTPPRSAKACSRSSSLAADAGEVVSRDEIFAAVWPEQYVGDDVLSRAISELRKHLGDDPRRPRYIETIRKGGYRLVAAVDLKPDVPEPSATAQARRGWMLPATFAAGLLLAAWMVSQRMREPVADAGRGVEPSSQAAATIRPLTSYPGTEWQPALSPDGGRIAFAWQGPEAGDLDVYVRAVNAEAPRQITWSDADESAPTFSPDGSRIAFIRDGADADDWQLCEIDVDEAGDPDRALRVITSGKAGAPSGLAWSPDSRHLAMPWRKRRDQAFRIARVDVTTGERQLVSRPPIGTYGDHAPAYSPDGRRLAFTRSRLYGIQDLFVLNLGDAEARRLTHDETKILGVDWLDDARLVFASNRGGIFELWLLSVHGGEPERLGLAGTDVHHPAAARGGGTLVVQRLETRVDIHRWPLRDTKGDSALKPSPIVASSRWDSSPHLSGHGRLAFASNRSGSPEIWISNADGSEPRRLTDFGGPLTNYPRWSPDGASIVFESRRHGSADVYRVAAEGGESQRLTDAASDEMLPSWSLDGASIYFASNRGGSWEVWKMPSDGGEPSQVTHGGGLRALESVDGWLTFSRFGDDGLWRMPAAGGDAEKVSDGPPKGFGGSWDQGREGLIYLRKAEDGYEVAGQRRGGDVVSHGPLPEPMSLTTWAVSPDRELLLAPAAATRKGDLYLIDGIE